MTAVTSLPFPLDMHLPSGVMLHSQIFTVPESTNYDRTLGSIRRNGKDAVFSRWYSNFQTLQDVFLLKVYWPLSVTLLHDKGLKLALILLLCLCKFWLALAHISPFLVFHIYNEGNDRKASIGLTGRTPWKILLKLVLPSQASNEDFLWWILLVKHGYFLFSTLNWLPQLHQPWKI